MRKGHLVVLVLLASIVGFTSCEKVLDVDLPDGVNGIVFEGYIENGMFPYLLISRSENYFSTIENAATAFANAQAQADSVFIEVDGVRDTLHETCLSNLTEEQQALALELLGFEFLPPGIDLCIYLNLGLTGELGKTYKLTAYVEGEKYQATTSINREVYLDSLWYKDELPLDSFGSIWCRLTDQESTSDYYYMWTENLTQGKSMAPIDGPSFGDRLFNGSTIEFAFYQGGNMLNDDGSEDEYWWYGEGDTVIVKMGTIDRAAYEFWESVDAASNMNPFSSPTPVFSNFDNGGRGVWAGYATTLDTIICVRDQ